MTLVGPPSKCPACNQYTPIFHCLEGPMVFGKCGWWKCTNRECRAVGTLDGKKHHQPMPTALPNPAPDVDLGGIE